MCNYMYGMLRYDIYPSDSILIAAFAECPNLVHERTATRLIPQAFHHTPVPASGNKNVAVHCSGAGASEVGLEEIRIEHRCAQLRDLPCCTAVTAGPASILKAGVQPCTVMMIANVAQCTSDATA